MTIIGRTWKQYIEALHNAGLSFGDLKRQAVRIGGVWRAEA